MENLLSKIAAQVQDKLRIRKAYVPQSVLVKMVEKAKFTESQGRSLRQALQAKESINIIAELKKASPTQGPLREDFDPEAIARSFAQNGAAALSVLTEEDYFQGKISYLKRAGEASSLPVLRKDFIIDEYQIYESKFAQADAVLLIAALLDERTLRRFISLAHSLDLDALVETHTKDEVAMALSAGANLIGINNRDLTTFAVSLETSLDLAPLIPDSVLKVSESGIKTSSDIKLLKGAGFDGFLVGEHLMRSPDPGKALRELLNR